MIGRATGFHEVDVHQSRGSILTCLLVSIVVSIPACHAGDRGSIPRRGEDIFVFLVKELLRNTRYHANPSLWVFFKLTIA